MVLLPGTMSPTEAAEIALRILHSLAQLQAAVDHEGHSLQPLPTVHRILASPQCLPHIAQVLHSFYGSPSPSCFVLTQQASSFSCSFNAAQKCLGAHMDVSPIQLVSRP